MPWLEEGYVLYTGGIEPRKNIDRLLEAYAGLAGESARAAPARDRLPRAAARARAPRRAAAAARRGRPGSLPGLRARRGSRAPLPGRGALRLPGALRGVRSADRGGNGVWHAGDRGAQLVADGARPGRRGALRSTRDRVDPGGTRAGAHRRRPPRALCARASSTSGTRGGASPSARRRRTRSWSRPGRRPSPRQAEDRRRSRRCRRSAPASPTTRIACSTSSRALRHRRLRRERIPPRSRRRRACPSTASRSSRSRSASAPATTRVVFCLGNSEFHAEALDLLRRRRSGVVLAHDVRLSGLYSWTAAFRPELLPHGFLDSLRSMYMHRVPPDVGLTGWLDYREADRYGIYMAREAIGARRPLPRALRLRGADRDARLGARRRAEGRADPVPLPRPERVAAGAAGRASAGDRHHRGRRRGEADGEDRRGVRRKSPTGIRAPRSRSSGPPPRRRRRSAAAKPRAGSASRSRVQITGASRRRRVSPLARAGDALRCNSGSTRTARHRRRSRTAWLRGSRR